MKEVQPEIGTGVGGGGRREDKGSRLEAEHNHSGELRKSGPVRSRDAVVCIVLSISPGLQASCHHYHFIDNTHEAGQ